MNKGDLIDSVAGKTGLSKSASGDAVDAVISSIQGALSTGGSVSLVGFGTFSVVQRAARTGRNPREPGKILQIPASKAVKFKAGSKLKQAVN